MGKSLNEWFSYLEPEEESNIRILAEYSETDITTIVYTLGEAIDHAGTWSFIPIDLLKIKGRKSSDSYFRDMQNKYEEYDEEYVNSDKFISSNIKEPLNILIKQKIKEYENK